MLAAIAECDRSLGGKPGLPLNRSKNCGENRAIPSATMWAAHRRTGVRTGATLIRPWLCGRNHRGLTEVGTHDGSRRRRDFDDPPQEQPGTSASTVKVPAGTLRKKHMPTRTRCHGTPKLADDDSRPGTIGERDATPDASQCRQAKLDRFRNFGSGIHVSDGQRRHVEPGRDRVLRHAHGVATARHEKPELAVRIRRGALIRPSPDRTAVTPLIG